jgi:hypothetical protein
LGQDIRPIAYAMEKSAVGLGGDTAIAQPDIQAGTTEINVTVSLSYATR